MTYILFFSINPKIRMCFVLTRENINNSRILFYISFKAKPAYMKFAKEKLYEDVLLHEYFYINSGNI